MAENVLPNNRCAQTWLFDFDNTLAALEREVDWTASRRELEPFLRSAGIPDEFFRKFPSRNLPLYNAVLVHLLRKDGAEQSRKDAAEVIAHASAIIEAFELKGVASASPLPGTASLLCGLHDRGHSIAIVTSNSSKTVSRWLTQHRLLAAVDAIVGRDSLLPLKPAPEMIIRALQLCAATTDAVFVGDAESDLEGARRAQLPFFAVAPSSEGRVRLRELGAVAAFCSPHDLGGYLGLLENSAEPK